MRWLRWTVMRLRALVRAPELDRQLDEELRDHVEREMAARIRAGAAPERARRESMLAFGGMERVREEAREARGVRLIEEVSRDLAYGVRTLRRAPGFALVVVAILALGIGLTSALFAAAHGVLMKPLPYAHAEDVRVLWQSQPAAGHPRDEFSPGNFMDVRDQVAAFAALSAALEHGVDYIGQEGPESWQAWAVTVGFFDVLGAQAHIGRTFAETDYDPGAAPVLLLSHEFWRSRFGADPGVIGSTLRLDGQPWQVIGVLPAAFRFPTKKAVYLPTRFSEDARQERFGTYLIVVGRLAAGATEAQAQGELSALASRLADQYPRTNSGVEFVTVPLKEQIVGDVRPILIALMSAVGLLLLVACSNVANLFLARTTGRGREFAVRAALGAGGPRLARQLLVEGAVLAAIGGAAGLVLAYYGIMAIRAFGPPDLPRLEEIAFEPNVALFAVAVSALTVLLFAALPAWRAASVDPQEGLASGGTRSTASSRRRRLSGALVIAEVALSFVLMIGAGLIVRSFVNLTTVDPGYRGDGVLAMDMFLYGHYDTPDQQLTFLREVEQRVRALPGVLAVGFSTSLPLHAPITREDADIVPEGATPAIGETPVVRGASASPGYFDALRIPLKRGRMFSEADDGRSQPVALISELLAREYYANQNPIGRSIRVSFPRGPVERQIVGVVGDVRHGGLDETLRPSVYVPMSQAADGAIVLTVRASRDPANLVRPVSRSIWDIVPTLPFYSISTLDDLRDASLRVRRFVLLLLGAFAISAVVLAALGVYGMLSQATAERTREIGLRLALGAGTKSILKSVLASGAALTLAGLAFGCFAAALGSRVLRSLLFGVGTLDPVTFIAAGTVILASAIIASVVPAWRAARVDPAITLKE